ncbi:MAG: hypothetical protein SWO11_08865 [Thermodesulfobacteriota bacterium]|nr:hypothetical protein [Thermodesulfobacteriota bacterium]
MRGSGKYTILFKEKDVEGERIYCLWVKRIMSEEDFHLSTALEGIERSNRLRIIMLITFFFLGNGLKLGQLAPILNALFYSNSNMAFNGFLF